MNYLIKSNGSVIAMFLHESDRDCCIEAMRAAYDDASFEAAEAARKEGES